MQVKSFVFLSVFLLVSVFVLPSFPAATTNSGSGSMQNPTIKFKSWQVGRSTGHNADNREHRSFITSTETTCQVLAVVTTIITTQTTAMRGTLVVARQHPRHGRVVTVSQRPGIMPYKRVVRRIPIASRRTSISANIRVIPMVSRRAVIRIIRVQVQRTITAP